MTPLSTAMKNVTAAESDDGTVHELKMISARDARHSLPTTKNEGYAVQFARGIHDRKAEIEKLKDRRVVALADLDATMGEKIDGETLIMKSLMEQLEESRKRLSTMEASKIRETDALGAHFDTEIAAAQKAIDAFEAAADKLSG